jgi:hypothetical protein
MFLRGDEKRSLSRNPPQADADKLDIMDGWLAENCYACAAAHPVRTATPAPRHAR